MLKHVLAATLVTASWFSSAQAVVIADTKVEFGSTTEYGAHYGITVIQDPAYDDPTTMWFTKQDGLTLSRLTPVTWNVDQGADYYLAEAGDVFTPQTITAGEFEPLLTLEGSHVLEVPFNGEFYLAIATSGPGPIPGGQPPSPFPRNVWGWAHFRNDANGLTLLGSAMAYHEGGIIVGTTTAVPEPASVALSLVGLAGVALARRRHLAARRPASA